MLLQEITTAVTALPGIGNRRADLLRRLGITTIGELLQHAPRRYEDRTRIRTLVEAAREGEGLVDVTVVSHAYFYRGSERVLKLVVLDQSGHGSLVCFGRNILARSFPVETRVRVWGQFSLRHGEIQTSLFEAEHRPASGAESEDPPLPGLVPVYPLTEGISQRVLRTAVSRALAQILPQLEDDVPERLRREAKIPRIDAALQMLHQPTTQTAADEARRRLVYGELFLFQLALARTALARRRTRRRARPEPQRMLLDPVRAALPFDLTSDQERVLAEIRGDCDAPWPMARLLQGDVGSGKTLVALLAACGSIERGEQAALMVPTELLARQHARSAAQLVGSAGVRIALVVGNVNSAQRRELTRVLAAGEVDLVIGTHALFSEGYRYANLGLVIIDEQHRFGVRQREELLGRGQAPDVLMMSATPIPRSLALTAFGDTEISTIRKLPPGRQPIRTRLARMGNEQRVYDFVRARLDSGQQAYLVYPAIEEGTRRSLRSTEEMVERLTPQLNPHRVAPVHSRLPEEDRVRTMEQFAAGEIGALVATSVVEVGVDVPNATVMVIEHAEQFGLAALHQLRGRVGRGNQASDCILVYQEPLTEDARERLRVLYRSTDGFFIAEEDLRIRGPGDLPGAAAAVRQSGYLAFRFADIRADMQTMLDTRDAVRGILEKDPGLLEPDHRILSRALQANGPVVSREEKT